MSNVDRYRGLVHPLLSTLLPASFLIPFSAILSRAIETRLPGLLAAAAVCLCTGFLAALFENLAAEERVRAPGRLRFTLVLLACCYLIVSAFLPLPLRSRFLPNFENSWYAVIGASQWLFTSSFLGTFRSREFLLEEMEGKRGNALAIAIRDAPTLTASALSGFARLRLASVLFAASLLFLLIVVDIFSIGIGVGTAATVFACFMFLPIVAALTNQYGIDHELACEGFPVDEGLRSSRLRAALIMIAVPFALAPFACGPTSPLPGELLGRFFSWLAALFTFKAPARVFLPQPDPDQSRLMEELARLRDAGRDTPGLDLSFLIEAIKRFFMVALPLAAIAFVAAPLFSKHFRAAFKKRSLLGFLARKLREFASLFRFVRHKKEAHVRVEIDELAPVREALAALTRGKKSRQKRREVGRMTRRFLVLIAWGTERAVPYGSSTAPGEYVRALAPLEASLYEDFLSVGDIFEEALYSDNVLDSAKVASYEAAIRRIVSPRPTS